jgi:hypothetical protein
MVVATIRWWRCTMIVAMVVVMRRWWSGRLRRNSGLLYRLDYGGVTAGKGQ